MKIIWKNTANMRMMDTQIQPLPHILRMNGMTNPETPITTKAIIAVMSVDSERSSMARIRAKSVSLWIRNAIAMDVPWARKNVIADKVCRNINQGIRASIASSKLLRWFHYKLGLSNFDF